jgi:hypothetical protein
LPTLAQLVANCQRKSYFSRSTDEIYAALSSAGKRVYDAVCNENRGFFIKFDESSVTLAANTTEYQLPSDLTQIVHMAERKVSSDEWATMNPTSLNNALLTQMQQSGLISFFYEGASEFQYYGPYLDSSATTGTQVQKIRITPAPADSHYVQLVYTAKWTDVVNASSTVMLPNEGTYAMEDFAAAELLNLNDDSLALKYEASGLQKLTMFLTWVRARQIQEPLGVEPYLD